MDCRNVEDINLKAGDSCLINLGISIQVPAGYETIMAPRSSSFKKFGLLQTNSIGVIDETYCGEGDILRWPVYATRDVHIPAGERLCQFRIQPNQGALEIVEVDHMEGPDRGGFGSTDKK